MNVHFDKDFRRLRHEMVESAIVARGVRSESVLKAMRDVPRESFLPEPLREFAYEDAPLPIEAEQTISQPYIVAFMTEALGLKGGEKVLEIGAGSGYAAAILSEIVGEVYTVERIGRPPLLLISATTTSTSCMAMVAKAGPSMRLMMGSSSPPVGPRFLNR
jgi:protein-L-isoaspartate(D-aspartate) O-methyltransferase